MLKFIRLYILNIFTLLFLHLNKTVKINAFVSSSQKLSLQTIWHEFPISSAEQVNTLKIPYF